MIRIASLASAMALALGASLAFAQDGEPPADAPPFQGTELGEGPWDFDSAGGPIHAEIVAKLATPWGMAFLPDGGLLVTERGGQLRHIHADGTLDPTPISGLPEGIYTLGIAGLNDVILHPDFASNRLIYLSYSKQDPDDPMNSAIAVLRARWDGGSALSDVEDIFVAQAWYGEQPLPDKCCGQGPAFGSYGGRMAFDSEGHLFLTSGDRNYGEMVANMANHFGKIVRLNDDGSVPDDNPYVRHLDYAPEIWTGGHRNPTGLSYDPVSGVMWSSEFGPRGGDEVNRIERGADYGWIRVTQGNHYDGTPAEGVRDVEGVTDATLVYGPPSINPGNLSVYRGTMFPGWDGDLFLATFTQGVLRYELDGDNNPVGEPEVLFKDLGQRWRDVRAGPDGALYLLTDMADGALIKVTPAD